MKKLFGFLGGSSEKKEPTDFRKIYLEKIQTIVPADCHTTALVLRSDTGLKKASYYIWKEEANLCFFPEMVNLNKDLTQFLTTIPLDDILHYEVTGERYHETKITGGGRNQVSIPGAVIGNAVGGPAGAVLLGNKGSKAIKSRDVVHEERELIVTLTGGRTITCWFNSLNSFKLVIPEKHIDFLTSTAQQTAQSPSGADELLKYKQLLDAGAITQEEFDALKKRILDL